LKEIWKDIAGYENEYAISNYGKVFSKRSNINLKPQKMTSGYLFNILYNKNKKVFSLHRLVAKSFISNSFNKPQVNHIDGNRKNNFVGNLEWVNQSENEMNKYIRQPELRKLSKEDIFNIIELYNNNVATKEITAKYNIDRNLFCGILNGKYYADIKRNTIMPKRKDLIKKEEISLILKHRKDGKSYSNIAKAVGRGKTSIARIIKKYNL